MDSYYTKAVVNKAPPLATRHNGGQSYLQEAAELLKLIN